MTTKKSTKTRESGKRDSVKSLRETVEVLGTQVAELTEELEKKSDKNVRLLAEFDNYKRRTQEERTKLFKYAGE
jgi:molecular chaperone GrpE (heat shock protein)